MAENSNITENINNDNSKKTDKLFYPILAESSSSLNENNNHQQKYIKLHFKLRNTGSWSFMDFCEVVDVHTYIITLKSIITKRHGCNICNVRLYKKIIKEDFEIVLCDDNNSDLMMRTIHDIFFDRDEYNDETSTTATNNIANANDYCDAEKEEAVVYYDFNIKDYQDPDPLLLI